MDRHDLLQPGLAQRVVRVGLRAHRPRPVQREGGGDVLEVVRLHLAQQRAHAAAVELEDAEGLPAGQELVGGLVRHVVDEGVEVEVEAAVEFDVAHRVVEDREVAQPQEVHLDQAQRLAARVVELGDDGAVGLALHQGDDVDERVRAHDHAGRVDAPLAFESLQALGGVDDGAHVGRRLVQLAELVALGVALVRLVEQLRQRHALAHDVGRHGLGDLLADRERHVEDAGGVLDGGLGLDGAVGDDLGDLVRAVLVADVGDDLGAAAVVEIDVEVRHGDALGVEEPLEQEAVLQRAQVRDPQRVRADRSRARAAARAHPDAVLLGPVDEVRDDQEVAGEAHRRDDGRLELRALAHLVGDVAVVALMEPALDLLVEPRVLGLALGHGILRHVGTHALVERGLDALGDRQGVVAGLGQVAEQRPHLLGGLEVVAVPVEAETVLLRLAGAGGDAQQRVVRVGVVGVHVVQVVGGYQGQLQILGQAQQVLAHAGLDVQAVVHELDVEVLRAEDVAELGGGRPRVVVLPEPQERLDLPRGAARGGDEALTVEVQQLPVRARLVEEPLQRRAGAQPEQIVHALGIGRPHGHVGVGALGRDVVTRAVAELDPLALRAVRARREVRLETDDRLDVVVLAGLVELVGAVEVAVVRDRQRGHAHALGVGEQVLDPGRPVEHRELGVGVEVNETVRHVNQCPPSLRPRDATPPYPPPPGLTDSDPARLSRRRPSPAPRRSWR